MQNLHTPAITRRSATPNRGTVPPKLRLTTHPIADQLIPTVGRNERLLATIMGLPLIDGIFPALILAGTLDTWTGILQVALLVFGGSATTIVILTEFKAGFQTHLPQLIGIGVILFALAVIEAALAPTLASMLDLELFERFTAIVIITLAAKTASSTIGQYLPRPSVTIGLGLLASAQPRGATLEVVSDPSSILHAILAVAIAMGFTVFVLALRNTLVIHLDMDRFRFGSAIALALVSGSIFGVISPTVSLIVLGLSAILSFTPTPRTPEAPVATTDG